MKPTNLNSTKIYHVLGLMSGTSLDGLDLAYCTFRKLSGWQFAIENSETIPYTPQFREKLRQASTLSGYDLLLLHNEYGRWLGEKSKEFIEKHNISVDFISSHGHTVFHQPERRFTFQLGDGQSLAAQSGYPTYSDFRRADVSFGGQGAPLVPIGDQLLFPDYDFCLNLGGIANVSFRQGNTACAFDIAPANMLLNHLMSDTGKTYDADGKLAASGKTDAQLYAQLNALEFYARPFPKSLGYEWFSATIIPLLQQNSLSTADKLNTATRHITTQIAKALMALADGENSTLLVTGGGAYNRFFIRALQAQLDEKIRLHIPSAPLVNFKEAMIFAFMGVLRAENEVNCLRSVTGAEKNSCAGQLFFP